MQHKTESNWPRFVRTPEAARLLDLSPRTLEAHRCAGTGPIYRKLGGRVVYAVADLQAWVEASARQSTSARAAVGGAKEPRRSDAAALNRRGRQ